VPTKSSSKEVSKKGTGSDTTARLGPVRITGGETLMRMALLLWGPAASGKTTFAATAPGEKLWITVGDQEHVSVIGRPDVRVADWSTLSIEDFWKHAASDNPFGLDQLLESDKSIETVVFDSLTSATYKALQKAVLIDKLGAGRDFTPSMQQPGIAGVWWTKCSDASMCQWST
jgi:hypothetical protein